MNKAKNFFTDIDKEYNKLFGIFPDYHYQQLWLQHGREYADRTIQDNVNTVWNKLKNEHLEKQLQEQRKLALECPF